MFPADAGLEGAARGLEREIKGIGGDTGKDVIIAVVGEKHRRQPDLIIWAVFGVQGC